MIRILVVDGHPIVRAGVRRVLEQAGDCSVVAEAGSAEDAVRLLGDAGADVLVVDLTIPGPGLPETLRLAREKRRDVRALVLGLRNGPDGEVLARRAGASGYLSKDACKGHLVDAVRSLASGIPWFGPTGGDVMADAEPPPRLPHEDLAPRELDVLRRIGAGQGTREIASALGLSRPTVAKIRDRILRRLGARGTEELVRYAALHGI